MDHRVDKGVRLGWAPWGPMGPMGPKRRPPGSRYFKICFFIIFLVILPQNQIFITFFAIYYRFNTIPPNVLHTNTHRTLLHILPFALVEQGTMENQEEWIPGHNP